MTKTKVSKEEIKKEEAILKQKPIRLIYCGPNIGFKVSKDTTYIGGIPRILKEEIEECKEIKNLFVPIEEYINTKRNLEEEGTIESLSYKAVEEFTRKKRGEK